MESDYLVTVCAKCLCASCWHGDFMCEESKTAGIVEKKASELRQLNRENSSHYSRENILRVSGSEPNTIIDLTEGWVIIHPNGVHEVDYFRCRFTHKYTGNEITPEEFRDMHRPGCVIKRMKLVDL